MNYRFDLKTAVKLAGFAFDTYNEPEAARWEEGTDKVRWGSSLSLSPFTLPCKEAKKQALKKNTMSMFFCDASAAAIQVRVAFESNDFVKSVYSGRLRIRLLEADDLPGGDFAESIVSGSGCKPYVMFAVTEGDEAKDKVLLACAARRAPHEDGLSFHRGCPRHERRSATLLVPLEDRLLRCPVVWP